MSRFSDESPAGGRQAIRSSGARRVTLDMRVRLDQADAFKGVPRGTAKPLRFLAAFQEAEPYLGLPVHAYKLVAWLVKQTQPQDWEEGSRPIAWPSARHQAEFLGLSPARVKQLNRALFEAGIFVMRDNEPEPTEITWPAIVDAADWLGGEMGISPTLWARACQVMGRPYAAVALALVSTRGAGHFTSGPGGYFAGMLRKYEKGELRLAGTLWALREAKWGKRRKSVH